VQTLDLRGYVCQVLDDHANNEVADDGGDDCDVRHLRLTLMGWNYY
jgi:hypothetical protein